MKVTCEFAERPHKGMEVEMYSLALQMAAKGLSNGFVMRCEPGKDG